MPLKIGFETVLYGRKLDPLELALDEIAASGFEGIEIAQSPAALRQAGIRNLDHLMRHLQANGRGLTVAGLVGGTLRERIMFCPDPKSISYLYVDHHDKKEWEYALSLGYRLALHPHLFMNIQRLRDAMTLLEEYPQLTLCPDTAHLTIVGDDPVLTILENAERLSAIHLKDWTSYYGRYSNRYARGFVELGRGDLNLEPIFEAIDQISKVHFAHDSDLWLIAEVDSTRTSTWASLQICADTLKKHGFLLHSERHSTTPPVYEVKKSSIHVSQKSHEIPAEIKVNFRNALARCIATEGADFYHAVVPAFGELVECHQIQIWVYTPAEQRLDLAACYPTSLEEVSQFPTCYKTLENPLCSSVIESVEAKAFLLTAEDNAKRFLNKSLLAYLQKASQTEFGPWMITIPITNTWNAHHVRFIVNLFPKNLNRLVRPWDTINQSLMDHFASQIADIAEIVGPGADAMLDEKCISAAGRIHRFKASAHTRIEFPEFFVKHIKLALGAEGVSYFAVNGAMNRLDLLCSDPDLEWNPKVRINDRYYFNSEVDLHRPICAAWRNKEIVFCEALTGDDNNWKSSEPSIRTTKEGASSFQTPHRMIAPVISPHSGEVIGMVRCSGRNLSPYSTLSNSSKYTDDDATVLESMIQAARPVIDLLVQQQHQMNQLGRLTHEINGPIASIRNIVDNLTSELNDHGIRIASLCSLDYLNHLTLWSNVAIRQIKNLDFHRKSFLGAIPVQRTLVNLSNDILKPAIALLQNLLHGRRVSSNGVTIDVSDEVNFLYVDQDQFLQVFYNLLSNAVKYTPLSSIVRISVKGLTLYNKVHLSVTDYGQGVPPNDEKHIFEPGFQGPPVSPNMPSGQGLGFGLAVCKSIIEEHKGRIELAHSMQPTTFLIKLPLTTLAKI